MPDDRRTAEYIRSLAKPADPFLEELRRKAAEDRVPIVRPETESLLRTLTALTRPGRILEIGTAIGYSAVVMAKASEAGILTIENYEKRFKEALLNIERAGLSDRIRVCFGDAGEKLTELRADSSREEGGFDLIFLDAAKGQYAVWLEDLIALLNPGGLLIADNILQEGHVLESRFVVERRDRTSRERMRQFLRRISRDPRLETSVLPVGDGVSLSVRKPDADLK